MTIQRASLLDPQGNVVNIIVLDTNNDWQPPPGHTVQVLTKNDRPVINALQKSL